MKITINVTCTPEEARTFLGLPDVKPMQDALVARLHEQLERNLERADPEILMKTWFAPGVEGLTRMQNAFWDALNRAGEADDRKKSKGGEEK